jgi:hypothetical protein
MKKMITAGHLRVSEDDIIAMEAYDNGNVRLHLTNGMSFIVHQPDAQKFWEGHVALRDPASKDRDEETTPYVSDLG